MSIELIGLAYDSEEVNKVWWNQTLEDSFISCLKDSFRTKVDYRSVAFRKSSMDLLYELDHLIQHGGRLLSVGDLCSIHFASGLESLPFLNSDFNFDYALIRFYSSLALVDDFVSTNAFFKVFLDEEESHHWITDLKDYHEVYERLKSHRFIQDKTFLNEVLGIYPQLSVEETSKTFIEFFGYCFNNRLSPFLYNSESDPNRLSHLIDRRKLRNNEIVTRSFREQFDLKGYKPDSLKNEHALFDEKDVAKKFKLYQEFELLKSGLIDVDPMIRQKSAEELKRFLHFDIADLLKGLLQDEEISVRQEAIRVLSKLSGDFVEEMLLSAFSVESSDQILLSISLALCERGNLDIIPLMLEKIKLGKNLFATVLSFHRGLKLYPNLFQELEHILSSSKSMMPQGAFGLSCVVEGKESDDFLLRHALGKNDIYSKYATYALCNMPRKRAASLWAKMKKEGLSDATEAYLPSKYRFEKAKF